MKMEVAKQEKGIIQYSPDEIDLIKSQIAPGATDSELKLFLYQCQKTGLDALSRQIYCIHRNTKNEKGEYVKKMTIQTSIDGFRVIAERSGQYAGQGEPEFVEENGKIICCKVRVFKFAPNGQRYEAAVGVAYWDEYAQNSPMWSKFKHSMLAKCAESIALRKAFPLDLSGLYTGDEMEQAEEITPVEVVTVSAKQLTAPATTEQPANEPPPLNATEFKVLEGVVSKCETVKALNELFENQEQKVKDYPPAKALFTERKKQINPKTAQTA